MSLNNNLIRNLNQTRLLQSAVGWQLPPRCKSCKLSVQVHDRLFRIRCLLASYRLRSPLLNPTYVGFCEGTKQIFDAWGLSCCAQAADCCAHRIRGKGSRISWYAPDGDRWISRCVLSGYCLPGEAGCCCLFPRACKIRFRGGIHRRVHHVRVARVRSAGFD